MLLRDSLYVKSLGMVCFRTLENEVFEDIVLDPLAPTEEDLSSDKALDD